MNLYEYPYSVHALSDIQDNQVNNTRYIRVRSILSLYPAVPFVVHGWSQEKHKKDVSSNNSVRI